MKILNKLVFYSLMLFFQLPLPASIPWKEKTRVKTLQNLDMLLYWGLCKSKGLHTYPPSLEETTLNTTTPQLQAFEQDYGYFSPDHPLISKVSNNPQDIELVLNLLKTLSLTNLPPAEFEFIFAELLGKVLAYRDLKPGQVVHLPRQTPSGIHLEPYTVDEVFNIWKGMPAFGLIPSSDGIPSILLFRGTDFSLVTRRGLASVVSDLDPSGPGLRVFFHARPALKRWLKSVHSQQKPAKLIGFSLGGALASYTFIYEHIYLSQEPSLAICSPGVSHKVIRDWYTLPPAKRDNLIHFINKGDLVSQVGTLFGTVYCLSTPTTLKPLSAHTALMSSLSPLTKTHLLTHQVK